MNPRVMAMLDKLSDDELATLADEHRAAAKLLHKQGEIAQASDHAMASIHCRIAQLLRHHSDIDIDDVDLSC